MNLETYLIPAPVPAVTAPTAVELLASAGLDWTVHKRPLAALIDQGPGRLPQVVDAAPHVALVAELADGPVVLSAPKRGYEPFQNSDLAELADRLHSAGAVGAPERVEVMRGGRVVLVHCAAEGFTLGETDETKRYTVLGMSHDGTLPLFAVSLATRMFCQNQLVSMAAKGVGGIRVRHTSGMRVRLDQAEEAVARSTALAQDFERHARRLAGRTITLYQALAFWRLAWSTLSAEPDGQHAPLDADRRAWSRWDGRRAAATDAWLRTYNDESEALPGVAWTGWLAFNAVTRWIDNERVVRRSGGRTEAEARAYAALFGSAARAKTKILSLALQSMGGQA